MSGEARAFDMRQDAGGGAGAGQILAGLRALDRPLLSVIAILIVIGIIVSLAASPGATARIQVEDSFHFSTRHAIFAGIGAVVLIAASLLPLIAVRRISVFLYVIALVLVTVATFVSPDVKGASRWIDIGPVNLQPSEILKPAIIVMWAWMLSEHMKRPRFPGHWVALGLFAPAALLLLAQPDVGQTALLGFTFAAMLLLAGVSWRWIVGGAAAAGALGLLLYHFEAHVRARVDAFLNPTEPGYQVGRALDAIASGGLFGRGPGEGVIKRSLPDAHSDFVYAVAAEEFGLLASIGLLALYFYLLWRGLSRSSRLIDPFAQLAGAGLVLQIVMQALIHIAVNLSLLPAKGMTLPLISYGGSSMMCVCLTLGFVLAITRARPGAYLYDGVRG
ncbi:MAG: FtsW/RodA/SpoVE family cell cycle protein [Hyphomonadaceae bacterium]